MASTKMMFVYVDHDFNIKAISPVEDTSYSYKYVKFPYAEIDRFMNGTASIGQYKVVQDQQDITKFQIESKLTKISTLRELNSFLSLINNNIKGAEISLKHFPDEKKIEFRMNKTLREQIKYENNYSEGELEVIGVPYLQFYVCATGDPNFLIETLSVPTADLIGNWGVTIYYDARYDYANVGIFTKKYFKTYSYEVVNE